MTEKKIVTMKIVCPECKKKFSTIIYKPGMVCVDCGMKKTKTKKRNKANAL